MAPEVLAALIAEVGKTARWLIGGLGVIVTALVTGYAPTNLPDPVVAGILLGLVVGGVGATLGLAGYLYGRAERNFRLQKTKELCDRINELEVMIDPQRTSSALSRDGTTNPRDE